MKIFLKHKLILVAFLATFITNLAAVNNSYAGDGSANITISPFNNSITLQPGQSYRGSFNLSNIDDSTSDLNYEVVVQTMSIVDDNNEYTANFGATDAKYSDIVNWITLDSPSKGTLAPQKTTTIEYTINVPEDATPGGQYAGISVRQQTGKVTEGVGVVSQGGAAYIIYGKVAGQATESGSVLENNIASFFFSRPLTATSIVENTGNVHAEAKYTLKIFPLFSDEEVYTNEEQPAYHMVLPDTRRFVTQSWDAESIPTVGIYRMEQTIEFMGETSVTSKIIILCPMWLLLVVVFIIVFIVIWLVMRSKNRKAAAKGKDAGKSSKSASASSTNSAPSSRPTPSDKPEPHPGTE